MKKALFLAVLVTAGCATPSHKIPTAYVSPMVYQGYSCDQLTAETHRIGSRLQQMGVDVDKEARGDKWAMGVGLVLFWPALFFLDGDKAMQSEYARLKGEYEAIQQAGNMRCSGAPPPVQAAATPSGSVESVPAAPPAATGPRELDPAKRCDACARLTVP